MAQHTCTVNPPDRTEANQSLASAPHHPVPVTHAPLSSLTLLLLAQTAVEVKRIPKSNFLRPFARRQQHTCLSGTLYGNVQRELNDKVDILRLELIS